MKFYINWLQSRHFLVAGILVLVIDILFFSFLAKPLPRVGSDETLVEGVIVSYPLAKNLQQSFLLKTKSETQLLQVFVPRVLAWERGDEIGCKGPIEWVSQSVYYKSLDVAGVVFSCSEPKLIKKTTNPLFILSNYLRTELDKLVMGNFTQPHSGLLLGMLIGSDSVFSSDLQSMFVFSGTGHIIAVSGFNVNFIAELLLLAVTMVRRKVLILITLPLLFLYVLVVGFDNIPALRTLIYSSYMMLAVCTGRRPDIYNAFGLCLLTVCLLYPQGYLSLSFQLSFTAFLGLLTLAPILKRFIPWRSVLVSTVCLLATLPVIAIYFGVLYPWALPLNIIIAPLLPLILELAVITLPLMALFPGLAHYLSLPLKLCLDLLLKIITQVQYLPEKVMPINPQLAITIMIVLILTTLMFYKYYEFSLSRHTN